MNLEARLGHLPIFPLPSVQLFPHALLPLHVFEPRYRQLLRDCLEADRVLAVAGLLEEEEEEGDPPAVRPVCGVGEVIAHEALPDGRSNILLHGLRRARIVQELPPSRLYRVVRAVALEDHYAMGVDLGTSLSALVALSDQLAARLPSGGETLRALARSHKDPGALSDVLAAALVTDTEQRQALLENLDVAARLEGVMTAIASAITRFDDARGPAN